MGQAGSPRPGAGGVDLVIFDCDGVLVDSERLAVRTEAAVLEELGWPLSEDEIVERYVGRSASYMQGDIERHLGRRIDWDAEFEARYAAVFRAELEPVAGVADALDRIALPTCVASSGSVAKVRRSLGLTGLLERFDGRIFSAEEVARGKPAPDLFLHAARHMGAVPRRCAVVEDSVAGVEAGLAAGMAVFAFGGGVTHASRLGLPGAVVFDDMGQLPRLLGGARRE